MKEKNKSKFYVKSSIIAIILILLGTVLFFAVNNNTGILKISSIKEKMTEKSMDDTIKSGTVYINTEAEFALFVKEFNKNAENSEQDIITVYLQKDLDLKDYDNWERISLNHNNRNNHVPKIIFDGQGHVIKNMKMNYDDGNGAGLFIDYVNQNEIHVTIKKRKEQS